MEALRSELRGKRVSELCRAAADAGASEAATGLVRIAALHLGSSTSYYT
jgi:hypothetical protein